MADTYDDNPFLTIAARSYARGFVPEPEEETPPPARSKGKDKKTQRGFLSEAASALGAGVVGAGEAVAGLGEMAGIPGADTAREYLKGLQESEALRRPDYLAGPETILDKPERALDWRWWTRAVGENLPNMAAMLIPGAAALKMAKAAKWGLAGKTLAVKAGTWAGSFPLESGAAYGQAKDEMIKSGRYDADTIERIATLEGIAVGTVNALLEGLPGEKLLLKQVGADRILKRIVRQAMLEGGTETAQEAVNILAEQLGHQPDITMKQAIGRALEAGIVGGVLGGGAGGTVGTYVHKQNTKQYQGLADQLNLTNDIYAWKDAGVDDKEIAGRVAERLDAVRLMQQGERPIAGERQYGLEEEQPRPDLAVASEDMAAGRSADQPLVETGQAVTDAARTEQIKAAQSAAGTEIAEETQEEPAKAEQIGGKEAAAVESGKGPEKKPFILPEIDTEEMVSYVLYAGKKPRYEPPPGLWEDFAAGAAAAKRKMLAAFGMKPRTAAAESRTGAGRPAVAAPGSMVDGAQAVTDIGTAPGRQANLDEAAAQQRQKQTRKAGANMLAGAVLEENADTQERAGALAAAQQGLTGGPLPGAAETPAPGAAPTAARATPTAAAPAAGDFVAALGDLTPEGQAQAEAALAARRQEQEEEQAQLAAAAASQNQAQIAAAQEESQDLLSRIAGEDPEKRRIAGDILTGMSDRVLVAAVRKAPTDSKEPGLGLAVEFDDRGLPALNGQPVDLRLLRSKLAEARVASIDAKRTKDEQDRQAAAARQDMLRQQQELRAARSVLKYFPAQMPSEREIMILDNAAATPGRLTTGELQTLAQIKKRISATGKKTPPASVQTLAGKPATETPGEKTGAAATASVAPGTKAFIENKIRQLGSIEAVNAFYAGSDTVSDYARTMAPKILGIESQAEAPALLAEPATAKSVAPAHEEATAAGALEREAPPDLEKQIDEMHLDFMIGTAEMALETPSGKLDTQEDTKWVPFGGWITAMTKQGMDKKEIANILKKARAGQRLTGLQEQKLAAMKNAAAGEAAEAEKAAAQIHYEGHGYIPVGEDIVLAPPESKTAEYDPTEPGTRFVIGGQEFVLKDPGKLSAGTILKNVEYIKPARAAEEEGFAFGEETGGGFAFGEEEAAPARQEEAATTAPIATESQIVQSAHPSEPLPVKKVAMDVPVKTRGGETKIQSRKVVVAGDKYVIDNGEYPDSTTDAYGHKKIYKVRDKNTHEIIKGGFDTQKEAIDWVNEEEAGGGKSATTITPSTAEIEQPGATSQAGPGLPVNTAEKGVAMYARAGEENRAGETPMTREVLEKHARKLMGDSKNQPELVVVEKASDLPFEALEDAKGVLFDGKMYLVAEQIALPEDADETIFHEFIGHFGLNGFFGEKIRPALDSIHVHNPLVRQYTNEWMKSNRDFQEKYGVSDLDYHYRAIEEAMARMAQENKPFTFAKRLLSSVQTLLRKAGMTRLADSLEAKTNAEALTMLHKAGLYIKKGKTVASRIPEPLYPYFMTARNVEMSLNEKTDTEGEIVGITKTAPPSITPEEDGVYLAAVKRGDMETAQKLVDEAARQAGYAERVYRGTVENNETILPESFEAGGGIYTTNNPAVAEIFRYEREYGEVLTEYYNEETEEYEEIEPGDLQNLYVKIVNPLVLDENSEIDPQEFVYDTSLQAKTIKKAVKDGHDGIIVEDVEEGVGDWMEDGTTYIVFKSNQAKSAEPVTYDAAGNVIPLSERFNEENPDIRYALAEDRETIENNWPEGPPQTDRPGAVPRTAWAAETAKSVQHSTVNAMRAQPGYDAAKAGDFIAGVRVARAMIKPKLIAKLKDSLPADAKVIVVPVRSLEASGENAIPSGMADVIADMAGWEQSDDIFQINKVEHTGKSALERLKSQAAYDGPVEKGALYLIVDDVVTQGGTLANLKGMIEAGGGKVIGIHTIGAAQFSTNLKVGQETIEKLKKNYGQNLDPVLSYIYGGKINVEHITESEARTFLNNRQELLDAARAGRPETGAPGRVKEGEGIPGRTEAAGTGEKVNEPQGRYASATLAGKAKPILERGGSRKAGSRDSDVRGRYATEISRNQDRGDRQGAATEKLLGPASLRSLVEDLARIVKGLQIVAGDGETIQIKTKSGANLRLFR